MYLVAGLGITGQSVLRYFKAQKVKCLAFDTRENLDINAIDAQYPGVEIALGEIPSSWLNRFRCIVLSPGIAKSEPWVVALRKLGKEVIGDIELFARAVGSQVVAITGSNGKSTVTTLTGLALEKAGYKVAVGGNIGQPVLDLLLDENVYDVFVIELSSFQLETTYSLHTVSATVLNISEDHMDRYDDLEAYIQAKTQVFADTDYAVLPIDFSPQGVFHHAKILRFGLDCPLKNCDYGLVESEGKTWLGYHSQPLVAVEDMRLQGRHHLLNALATMALCHPFSVSEEHFLEVLKNFNGLAHRTQHIATLRGVDWINDSKGTNVGATLTAIQSLGEQSEGHLILLAGGVGKDADFSSLQPAVRKYCKQTILFGRDKGIIQQALPGVNLQLVEDLPSAIKLAAENAEDGDVVLFSPACASFDQFDSYVHRGEVFSRLVMDLQGE
ncbi:UDP-N-acetylmuramoyl-L-alanine--D-glutamate ligase [Thiomicrorhabdus heinhorstiae]|uniref:UDP-N-acetylmuramoylalanine--D-glutamate ligase n=1 Tax=Thiomicrorhabdus heinhorstiae TaxID=2748010 RepID=A0ABS0C2Q1_9GAMM|nr:UDP-N-acetylmuramoyl-L-alanine--D-glutamate ligase [Thiomicrorhabdus heinhorstiae]MBF6058562.1 UDP-N-acetylmuramoyl-L-alanine--D-glutamate ligase [Thiomicrorhabdus heinhorstiae]